MKTIDEVLKNNLNGLHYGNRILLPFAVELLKVVVENDIIMDFSHVSKNVQSTVTDDYTEIYFFKYKNLQDFVTKYETIKLVAVEKGNNIFDIKNHRRIALHLKSKHKLEIEEINDDILFIE